ncbi:UNVERIFIED_CONTAM: hypothetical protein FKN15_052846 [Acipenser sinensis]
MKRWHEHQRELKEGGATWCLACLEYGHLPEVCRYEDPLFVQAFDRGEVETAEEWIHLKAIPSPQVDQETCLTCLKGEEWCFAIGKVGHKPPDQPPPWQEVELLVMKKGRRGGAKKAKEQAPAPEGELEHPAPRRGERVHPAPVGGEPVHPAPGRGEPVHPAPMKPEWNLCCRYSLLDSGTSKYRRHQLPPVVPRDNAHGSQYHIAPTEPAAFVLLLWAPIGLTRPLTGFIGFFRRKND